MGASICLTARKGGVGKTSLAIHLAGYLASQGLRIRLIDLDSQASLSQFWLGSETVERLRPDETIEACLDGSPVGKVEHETKTPSVSLVPAHLSLRFPRESVLPDCHKDVDLALLDTPPDLTNPVIRATLLASNFVLSPVDPESFGAQSIVSVQQALHSVALAHNQSLRLLGFVVNKRERLTVHRVIEDTLRRLHGNTVFNTVIPSLSAFKESIIAGQPVTEYQPKSKAADVIRELADEVFQRIEQVAKVAA